MGLLSGSVSVTRFNVTGCPEQPDFEKAAFKAIQPGSEVRERVGFIPFEPEASYEVGTRRFAFRVRIDRLSPDPTAVQERVKELIKVERDNSAEYFISSGKRKKFREMAEEELIVKATPRSKVIECCLDNHLLVVGSTANAYLGMILELLRQIDVVCEFKAPWLDRNEPDVASDIIEFEGPGQSVAGCRFIKALLSDPEIMIEPESGSVKLQTREARVTLSGAVLSDLLRYVEEGAEILSAKLVSGENSYRLDGPSFRISGLKVETEIHQNWIELLDERLQHITGVWDQLEAKYAALGPDLHTDPPV